MTACRWCLRILAHALRSKHRGHEAVLFAFDLIELEGDDLRDLPLAQAAARQTDR
jgi:ATP-dependent DNA ligase